MTEAQAINKGVAEPLQALPRAVAAIGTLGVQTICNFFIPFGSGQADVTTLIMALLADLTDLSRQTAEFACQFGDSFTNMPMPINSLVGTFPMSIGSTSWGLRSSSYIS